MTLSPSWNAPSGALRSPICSPNTPKYSRYARLGGRPMHKLIACFLAVAASQAWADLDGSYILPLEHPAIQYGTAPVNDAVTRLEKQIASGEVKIAYDQQHGYLKSLLAALHVP